MVTKKLRIENTVKLINDSCRTGNTELDHIKADDILCDLLTEIGYVEVVKAWKSISRWYS